LLVAALVLAIWVYLVALRGGFWLMREAPSEAPLPARVPRIAVVVPARNEAAVVGPAVKSLASQQYPGEVHIVLVDDHSTDGTADAARAAAPEGRLTMATAGPLPSGWTGKLWAVSEGVRRAAALDPEYLLLTDADIVHEPHNLERLVARAAAGGYDLVSYMATLNCRTAAERTLVPAFVFFFFMLYPPAWVSSARRRTAGAAGGCMLVRRAALERIGGVAAIRDQLIDDCALARAVKRSGGRVWLGLSRETVSIREYGTLREIGRMVSRTAFTQLHYSWLMLAGTVIGMALTYLAPPALAIAGSGPARAFGAAAWALMSAAYFPVLLYYRRSPLWAPLLPLSAAFYTAATVWSAWRWLLGAGGEWKGRVSARVKDRAKP